MNHDREAQAIHQMVTRFREQAQKGSEGAQELLDDLLRQESALTHPSNPYRHAWEVLLAELKRRGGFHVAVAVGCIRTWIAAARSRAESLSLASSEAFVSSFGSLIVATSVSLTALAPAVTPAFVGAASRQMQTSTAAAAQTTSRSAALRVANLPRAALAPRKTLDVRAGGHSPAEAGATVSDTPQQIMIGGYTSITVAGQTVPVKLVRLWVNCDPQSQLRTAACAVLRWMPSLGLIH